MKRKIDMNKVYAFIGKAVIVILFHLMLLGFFLYGFMTATTLY